MENSITAPQRIKNRTTIWSGKPTSGTTLKGNENILKEICAPPYSLQHYLLGWPKSSFRFFCDIGRTRMNFLVNPIQQSRHGNILSVYQQINGLRNCFIYIYTHTHTHIYVWVYIYIYMSIYIYIYTYTHIYTHKHMYICIHTYVYVYMYMCIHTYMHMYICMRIYI